LNIDRTSFAAVVALAAVSLVGCRQDMHDQPKLEAYEASTFFPDGMASRLPPAGTVARGLLQEDTLLHTGKDAGGAFVAELPIAVDRPTLVRGRERYNAFCGPCHGALGDGQGMVARRGFKQPPSFHEERVRAQPVGYYYDVMTRGFGVMPAYNHSVTPEDRWAIAAYLRVLQQSQRSHLAELPAQDREAIAALATQGAPGSGAADPHAAAAPVSGEVPLPNEAPRPGHASPDAPMGDPAGGDPTGGEEAPGDAAAAPTVSTTEPRTEASPNAP
jgi:mono/diheme cytochrome c family protein